MKESFAPILNEKAKMSWWTAFKLSGKNLLTKKGRTALVSIAGSIGIIGVASVLSISTGVNDYITSMQDDMLSGNPIQVSESTYDLSTITKLMTPQDKKKLANQIIRGEVNVDHTLDQILSTISTTESFSVKNDITKDYLEFLEAMPKDYYADMSYTYGYHLGNNIYTGFTKSGETEQ
jgi:putative ABC transport system permease protein